MSSFSKEFPRLTNTLKIASGALVGAAALWSVDHLFLNSVLTTSLVGGSVYDTSDALSSISGHIPGVLGYGAAAVAPPFLMHVITSGRE